MKATAKGLKRIINAFTYSWDGFVATCQTEASFRQDLAVFIIFSALAMFLNIPLIHKLVLISCLLFILIAELVNTAIECIVDRISEQYHPLSRKAKDIGSLLVFLSYINALLWWGSLIYLNFAG